MQSRGRVLGAVIAVGFTLAVVTIFGCTGDQGPQGIAGTADCVQCHNDDTEIAAKVGQWQNSVHATGGNFERNYPPCSGCHTSEGFVARMETGDPGTPLDPSAIGCFTCHTPHTTKDFELRTEDPVLLVIGGGTYDHGESNICANCHQAREAEPVVSDTTRILSSHWGPHHGVQASMLAGYGGYEFAGYSYENSYHSGGTPDGCVHCHMAAPFGAQAGGHTWNMTYEYHGSEEDNVAGCNVVGCHGDGEGGGLEDFNRGEVQTDIEELLEELKLELMAHNLVDEDGEVIPDTLNTRDRIEAGALYNYLFVEEDRSMGIHNTDYAEGLLESALDELSEH